MSTDSPPGSEGSLDTTDRPGASARFGLLAGGEGAIAGTVVCGGVIAAGAGSVGDIAHLELAIGGTVLVYFLAHTHAAVLGAAITHGHHPRRTVLAALRHGTPMLLASLVPLAVLTVAALLGAPLRTAATVALVTTTVLLMAYSYVAARRHALALGPRLLSTAAGAGLGLLLILLKSLH